MKTCSKCRVLKSADSFTTRSDSADGLYWQCKACVSEYSKKYHAANRDKVAAKTKRSRSTEAGKNAHRLYAAAYRKKHPDKSRARLALAHAVYSGSVTRPTECSACRCVCKPEAHHYAGYGKGQELIVSWLCRTCHAEADRLERGLLHHFLAVAS